MSDPLGLDELTERRACRVLGQTNLLRRELIPSWHLVPSRGRNSLSLKVVTFKGDRSVCLVKPHGVYLACILEYCLVSTHVVEGIPKPGTYFTGIFPQLPRPSCVIGALNRLETPAVKGSCTSSARLCRGQDPRRREAAKEVPVVAKCDFHVNTN